MTEKRFVAGRRAAARARCVAAAMVTVVLGAASGMALATDNGVVSKESPYGVKETMNRVAVAARMQNMKVIARIDHAAVAQRVGRKLRAAEVAIISAPALEADVMACGQSAGLDMPSKLMAWQDIAGGVWLSYGHPAYAVARHNLSDCDAAVRKLAEALEALSASAVTGRQP